MERRKFTREFKLEAGETQSDCKAARLSVLAFHAFTPNRFESSICVATLGPCQERRHVPRLKR
jgi:hypothetical protein